MLWDPSDQQDPDRVKALLLAVVDQFLDKHGYSATHHPTVTALSPTRPSSTPADIQRGGLGRRITPKRPRSTLPGAFPTHQTSSAARSPSPTPSGRITPSSIRACLGERRRVDWIDEIIAVRPY